MQDGDWLQLAQKIEELDDRIRSLSDIDVDQLKQAVHDLQKTVASQKATIKKLSERYS